MRIQYLSHVPIAASICVHIYPYKQFFNTGLHVLEEEEEEGGKEEEHFSYSYFRKLHVNTLGMFSFNAKSSEAFCIRQSHNDNPSFTSVSTFQSKVSASDTGSITSTPFNIPILTI